MYCKNCGKEVVDGTKFCPDCGQPIENGNSTGQAMNQHLENAQNKLDDIAENMKKKEVEVSGKKFNMLEIITFGSIFLATRRTQFLTFSQISSASCSTHAGFGKYCLKGSFSIFMISSFSLSYNNALTDVVPASIVKIYFIIKTPYVFCSLPLIVYLSKYF